MIDNKPHVSLSFKQLIDLVSKLHQLPRQPLGPIDITIKHNVPSLNGMSVVDVGLGIRATPIQYFKDNKLVSAYKLEFGDVLLTLE